MEKTKKSCLKVTALDKGLRLDQYISKNLKVAISRSRIQQLINTGKITVSPAPAQQASGVSQKPVKAHYRVKEDDVVYISLPAPVKPKVLPEKIPLEIIFEDEDVLIINKPTGMVTHPAVGVYSGTLVNALLNYGCPLSTVNGPLRPGIVHRLDKDTSGLMVIAKNDFAHQKLAQQFRQHTVKRKYIAIVAGKVAHNEGVIDLPIARDAQNRQKMAVSFLKKARHALTRYRVLKRYRDISVLELSPHTGRTHQLRVHLKFLGYPILGDKRYGQAGSFKRLTLHAQELGFRHPRTEKFIEFRSEVPQSFRDLYK